MAGPGQCLAEPALKRAIVREPHMGLGEARLRLERPTVQPFAALPVAPSLHEYVTHRRQRLRQLGGDRQGSFGSRPGPSERLGRRQDVVDAEHSPGVGLPHGSERERGVEFLGGFEVLDGAIEGLRGLALPTVPSVQVQLPGLDVVRRVIEQLHPIPVGHLDLQRRNHLTCECVLRREEVVERFLEASAPQRRPVRDLEQACRYAYAIRANEHVPLEDGFDIELAAGV